MSNEDWIHLTVLCGCDYIDNLYGLGFAKLIDFFQEKYLTIESNIHNYYSTELDKNKDVLPFKYHGIK